MPEEYDHFLRLIEGKTIIIGRRSYQIFGDDLSSAHNVVVSRSVSAMPGAVVVPTIEDALRAAASFGGTFFSAGGATIYEQTIPLADTMYLSFIKGHFAGDTYFPDSPSRNGRSRGGTTIRGSSSSSTGGRPRRVKITLHEDGGRHEPPRTGTSRSD